VPFDHAAPAETEKPRETLRARSIHRRCAAARDLSRFGVPDDIPALVKRAATDRSPAVRLGAAGAVADILSRYRVGPRHGELSDAQRQEIIALFTGIDPSVNGGLFSMLACIGIPEGYQRIAVGLRDPRGDVRLGAAIGMLRLCGSAAVQDDAELEDAVVALLKERRLKPDAAAEMAWVAARVGYVSARAAIGAMALTGAHADLRDRAIEQLHDYETPLRGAFLCDGRDAGEVTPTPAMPPGLAVFSEPGILWGDATKDNVAPTDGAADLSYSFLDGVLPGGIRRMFIRRVGDARSAFQCQGRTWYRADGADVVAAATALSRPDDLDWDGLAAGSPVDQRAPAIFDPWLPADPSGDLARGLLLARAGALSGALEALRASSTAGKIKLPPEPDYFLGRALLASGQQDEGVMALHRFLRRARKHDPRRAVAEKLV